MSINLKKYEKEIQEKWQNFVNNMKENQWILFCFMGQTEELSFYDSGDGGMEEFISELSDGRVMFGAIVVRKQNTEIFKIILILWQGNTVPTHIRTKVHIYNEAVKKFFKGYHLVLSAQNEDDLSENSISSLLSTVSGVDSSSMGSRKIYTTESTKISSNVKETINSNFQSENKIEIAKQNVPERKLSSKFQISQPTSEVIVKKAELPKFQSSFSEKNKPVEELTQQPAEEYVRKSSYEKPNPNKDIKSGSVSAARMRFIQPPEDKSQILHKTVQKPKLDMSRFSSQKSSGENSSINSSKAQNSTTIKQIQTAVKDSYDSEKIKKIEKDKNESAPYKSIKEDLEEVKRIRSISKSQLELNQSTKQETEEKNIATQETKKCNEKIPFVKQDSIKKCFQPHSSKTETPVDSKTKPNVTSEKNILSKSESLSKRWNESEVKKIETTKNTTNNTSLKKLEKSSSRVKQLAGNLQKQAYIEKQTKPVSDKKYIESGSKKDENTKVIAEVLYNFSAETSNELSIIEGEYLTILNQDAEDWWIALNSNGKQGLIPSNYIKICDRMYPQKKERKELSEIPVIGLYDFKAFDSNELSFMKDEKLTILISEDKDWWMARNSDGKKGLVPSNYVKMYKELEQQSFLQNKIDLKPEENNTKEFDFIAEYDFHTTNREELELTEGERLKVLDKSDIDWWKVENIYGKQGLVPVSYLKFAEFFAEKSENTKSKIQKKEWNDQKFNDKEVTENVICEAMATYDFSAKDSSELSFIEGQVLKIVKKQDSDWWVAKNHLGRIGLIPASYVKEVNKFKENCQEECIMEVECKYDFNTSKSDELAFKEGDILKIFDKVDEIWWMAKNKHGNTGLIPANYVKNLDKSNHPKNDILEKEITATTLYDFSSDKLDELSFKEGEILVILDKTNEFWWSAMNKSKKVGFIPVSYVKINESVSAVNLSENVANFEKFMSKYDFENETSDEIPLKINEIVSLVEIQAEGWALVINSLNQKGFVPFQYLKKC